MRKILSLILAIMMPCVAAMCQEPMGKSDIKTLPVDSMPQSPDMSSDSKLIDFETPDFKLNTDFKPSVSAGGDNKFKENKPDLKVDTRLAGELSTDKMPVAPHDPYAYDFARGGIISGWRGGGVMGQSSRVTMPGLMSRYRASVFGVHNAGNFTFSGGVSANRYMLWRGTQTMYDVSGAVTYHFNENISATVFGNYSINNSYYSMAAMPYMGTSGYGGYLTLMGSTLGVDLGVQRTWDPYAGSWVTSPIITPKIRFSDSFTLDLPIGWLVKDFLDDKVFKKGEKPGPMILPEMPAMPGQIPFGPPEMPH